MSCQDALDSMMTYLFCLTVVAEVETPIYPDSIFRNGLVVLRIYWPLTRSRDLFFLRRCHCQSSLYHRSVLLSSGLKQVGVQGPCTRTVSRNGHCGAGFVTPRTPLMENLFVSTLHLHLHMQGRARISHSTLFICFCAVGHHVQFDGHRSVAGPKGCVEWWLLVQNH
jgi:hypothetical protein